MGVATKSNNLADQLMFHELPRLARELDGGLGYTALKGYDHYPCLRKLERLRRSTAEIKTNRDPADTLTAIAVIYAYVCQSPEGDLDALGIRWRSVDRLEPYHGVARVRPPPLPVLSRQMSGARRPPPRRARGRSGDQPFAPV